MYLHTKELSKNFGGLRAVNLVNFQIEQGQLKSIIGPNGAGKSTFFNLIAGVLQPTSGKIFFQNKDITKKRLDRVSQLGITKTYQITRIFPRLTVFENIRISAQSRVTAFNFWSRTDSLTMLKEKAIEILEMVRLADKQEQTAATLSHGERCYLELGIALAAEPKILLLDEPTAGMSPAETREATELIRRLTDKLNLTVILVEHDMSVVMEISDQVVVLHNGRILAQGSCEEISHNEQVQQVYLGDGEGSCWL